MKDAKELQRPGLQEPTLFIGNPDAANRGVRFIDADLNRQFRMADLMNPELKSHEAQRAKAINELMGYKMSGKAPFVIDIHSTTANMGVTFVTLSNWKLSMSVVTYAQAWLCHEGHPAWIWSACGDQEATPMLCSVGHEGIIIECGPVPHGVLRYDIVVMLRAAVKHILDYLSYHSRGVEPMMPRGQRFPAAVTTYQMIFDMKAHKFARLKCPTDELGHPTAMFHPTIQDGDFTRAIRTGDTVWVHFNGSTEVYDGRFGDEIFLVMVNEAADAITKFGSGVGFNVVKPVQVPVVPLPSGGDSLARAKL